MFCATTQSPPTHTHTHTHTPTHPEIQYKPRLFRGHVTEIEIYQTLWIWIWNFISSKSLLSSLGSLSMPYFSLYKIGIIMVPTLESGLNYIMHVTCLVCWVQPLVLPIGFLFLFLKKKDIRNQIWSPKANIILIKDKTIIFHSGVCFKISARY